MSEFEFLNELSKTNFRWFAIFIFIAENKTKPTATYVPTYHKSCHQKSGILWCNDKKNIPRNPRGSQNIKFQFKPPAASHFGGVWKREICSIKSVLNPFVPNLSMKRLLQCCRKESILNSNPLDYLSTDCKYWPCNITHTVAWLISPANGLSWGGDA